MFIPSIIQDYTFANYTFTSCTLLIGRTSSDGNTAPPYGIEYAVECDNFGMTVLFQEEY